MSGAGVGAAVAFEGVSKSYGPAQALREVSFTIAEGQIVALLGLNGAGKSTAVDLMLGLRRPDRGQVRVLGTSPQIAVAQKLVSAMLQTASLPVAARVSDAVDLARRLYGKQRDLDETLHLAGLSELAGRRCETLSGGQAQRVRFAMALAGRPRLMFLDEPTVGMDVEARRQSWAALRTVAEQGTTIVFATHYLSEADDIADTVILLNAGTVAASGPLHSVKTSVASRSIRFSVMHADAEWLARLDGVTDTTTEDETVLLRCHDADRVLAALYHRYGCLHEVTVTGGGLEDAVLTLTGHPDEQRPEGAS